MRSHTASITVYCNLTLAAEMEKDSIKSLREQVTTKLQQNVLQENSVNPYDIHNNYIELSIVFRTMIFFFRK